ncbi:hypothetical protein HDU78_003632 [Chytriomyces hyalinus]|nr:hypothetical protein HDU78_003632 [Chytriomyces hyalinus]
MDGLPLELIQAILMHIDIDEDLLQFSLVCRKFAAAVQDTTFALEHIRRRFQLSKDGMARFTKMSRPFFSPGLNDADTIIMQHHGDQLCMLWGQIQNAGQLPFAYNVALFVLASQVDRLFRLHFTDETTLRIVQSIDLANPINWDITVSFLAGISNVPALEYVINNHLLAISNTAIVKAIEDASVRRQTEALLLLLACPSSDSEPLSLDGALSYASTQQCAEAILNDPLKRVTCAGVEAALKKSVANKNLQLSMLLLQHGVSFTCLPSLLSTAPRFVHKLLKQPGIDPSYLAYLLFVESVYKSDCSAPRRLLNEGRFTIEMGDYAPVRMALRWGRTEHVFLFLEEAKRKSDTEPFKIVQEYADQNITIASIREQLLGGMEAIKIK